MIEYNDFKDLPIYYDETFNEYFTLNDLINYLEINLKQQEKFENVVYNLLKNQNINNKTIASLFSLSSSNSLSYIIKMIKNEL